MTSAPNRLPLSPDKISYASSGQSWPGRAFIRTVENMTGRRALLRRAKRHPRKIEDAENFWAEMVSLFKLRLKVMDGSLDRIPKDGPLVIVANHPYGILDGLFMGYILSQTRPDFRILANDIFGAAPQISEIILPISFDPTPEAMRMNLSTRKTAIAYLKDGGAMGVFPGGTVSTSLRPFGLPADTGWRSFAGKLILKSEATVVPIFFEGQNSRRFQIFSRVHTNLRLSLLINEFYRRVEDEVRICVGEPIIAADLTETARNGRDLMDELRRRTYALDPHATAPRALGYEFEDIHRRD